MRLVPALVLAVLFAAPAVAQSEDVTVNPDGDGQTLIDPATGQSRYVPPLLEPWQDDAIRLKPPGSHRAHKTAAATATPSPTASVPAPATTATAEPIRKPHRTAAVTPPAEPAPAPKVAEAKPVPAPAKPIRGFADIDLITGTGQQAQQSKPAAAPPPPKPAAEPAPKAAAPVRTASIEKPKARTPSGNRKDSITFASGASDPSTSAVAAVRALVGSLGPAVTDGNGRIQLMAYAGLKGEKSSDTRRLSLKRALVIRQLLIDDGIPSERIDVFAQGGAEDDGPLDRVDVFLKS